MTGGHPIFWRQGGMSPYGKMEENQMMTDYHLKTTAKQAIFGDHSFKKVRIISCVLT